MRDIPDFVGLDEQTYALTRDDIILLPEAQAQLLVKKKLAVFADEAQISPSECDPQSDDWQ